jgi:hypothetical protein
MTIHLDSLYGGHWGEHPAFPPDNWAHEALEGSTRLSYWDWVQQQIDIAEEEDLSLVAMLMPQTAVPIPPLPDWLLEF